MKREFWALLFGASVIVGTVGYSQNNLLPSAALAQPAPQEFSLEPMDVKKLNAILQKQVDNISSTQPGQWQFAIDEVSIIVLADGESDRMRIVSPVMNAKELTAEQTQKMMLANFHTTLDARYAIANGQVVATFIHPLSSLQERDLLSALNQVSSLTATFGTNYSSGELLFVPRVNGEGNRERENSPLSEPSSEDIVSAIPR